MAMSSGGEHEKRTKGWAEMLGEFFREAGVLVGVFGFLDVAVRETHPPDWNPALWGLSVISACATLTFIGMAFERWRQP